MKKLIHHTFYTVVFGLLFQISLSAQINVTNTLMGSGSFSTDRPNISIASSFGETFIFSASNSTVYVNQGFHNSEVTVMVSTNDISNQAVDVTLYPNPVQNEIHIRSELSFEYIKVYDLRGQLILNAMLQGASSFDLSQLKSGFHIIELRTSDNSIYVGKIIKI